MTDLLQILATSVVVGCIYGMAALGFTIVFNATRLINFANGEFLVLGGLAAAAIGTSPQAHIPTVLLVPLIVATVGLVGFLQGQVLSRARSRDPLIMVMLTIALSVVLRGIASLIFGRDILFMPDFGLFPPIVIGGVFLAVQAIWIVLSFVMVSALLWFLFNRTITGKAMQAVSQDPRAAALCGIEPRLLTSLAFGVAGLIGGLAGVLMAPISPPFYDNGIFLGLKGFAAAIVGGIGNPLGSILGGLLIGLIESLGAGYGASSYKDAIAFLLIVVILIFRPAGLLGTVLVRRV